ncbi:MAG: hypothetical protein Kow0099_19470 [Candidatus Abyssubacteria bacterium]
MEQDIERRKVIMADSNVSGVYEQAHHNQDPEPGKMRKVMGTEQEGACRRKRSKEVDRFFPSFFVWFQARYESKERP